MHYPMKFEKDIEANVVDIRNKSVYPARVRVEGGRIASITRIEKQADTFLLPGFIDSHIHIESSMLVPSEFARLAVVHGTVATVSDPHEIANVLGIKGVEFMIENGKQVPFKFFFGAPSCVPATPFETAGAAFSTDDLDYLLAKDEVKYLSEMMNWPGVLSRDDFEMKKIEVAQKHGKPVDGHAPGLTGEQARGYVSAGISTDHECFTKQEALDKMKEGMFVQIREGSAARNFEALYTLIDDHWKQMMFCSDDKHPDDLEKSHINELVSRAVKGGQDLFKVLEVACVNPVKHYGLPVGLLRVGDPADMIEVDNLVDFNVLATWINGRKVAEKGQTFIRPVAVETVNNFHALPVSEKDLEIPDNGTGKVNVIEAIDGELVTNKIVVTSNVDNGRLVADPDNDILKIAVVNRYIPATPAIGFIKGFGIKNGAIASSVGHDSHNIIAVGTNDAYLAKAINHIIAGKGGMSLVSGDEEMTIPLPVAGIMSADKAESVAAKYAAISAKAKSMGSRLRAPYMTLSFMALLVIPSLKLSDKGLFDGEKFEFVEV